MNNRENIQLLILVLKHSTSYTKHYRIEWIDNENLLIVPKDDENNVRVEVKVTKRVDQWVEKFTTQHDTIHDSLVREISYTMQCFRLTDENAVEVFATEKQRMDLGGLIPAILETLTTYE